MVVVMLAWRFNSLDDVDVFAVGLQRRGVGASEVCQPTCLLIPTRFGSGCRTFVRRLSDQTGSLPFAAEDPILIGSARAELSPCKQSLHCNPIDRNRLP
jgi:hypothetical protein